MLVDLVRARLVVAADSKELDDFQLVDFTIAMQCINELIFQKAAFPRTRFNLHDKRMVHWSDLLLSARFQQSRRCDFYGL